MNFTLKDKSTGLLTVYAVLAILAIGVAGVLLTILYYALSLLAMDFFLGLDLSAYGQVSGGGGPGYALLGLGLGAAGGAIAAQHRYRLSKSVLVGAVGLAGGLCMFALVSNTAHLAAASSEATAYVPKTGWLQCPACATLTASSIKPSQHGKSYGIDNLLDKNDASAWISDTAPSGARAPGALHTLDLVVNIPAGQQLVGLRVRNGYGKNAGVYRSFSRVRACHISSAAGEQTAWTLPDERTQELFIPLTPTSQTPASLTFSIDALYEGENHEEVALSALSPVLAPQTININSTE